MAKSSDEHCVLVPQRYDLEKLAKKNKSSLASEWQERKGPGWGRRQADQVRCRDRGALKFAVPHSCCTHVFIPLTHGF